MDEVNLLKSIYDNLLKYRDEEYDAILKNKDRMEAIDVFLKSVTDELDIKIFSPRREEDIHREKIQSLEKEKIELKKDNERRQQKVKVLSMQMEELDGLIKCRNEKKDNNENSKIFDIFDIQEKERQRIANDLHDSTIQNLTHLIHAIELSSLCIDKDIIRAKLEMESCIKKVRAIIDEMRQIVFDLRPMLFDDLGFKNGIDNFITNIKTQYPNFIIDYDVCDLNEDDFNEKNKNIINLFMVTVYRIIQEALTNAVKHSKGERIILIIEKTDGKCVIHIMDDGKEFIIGDNNEKLNLHFGMMIMQERIELLNGKMSIYSNSGTKIKITIPMK